MRKPITALAVAVLAGITGLGLVAPSVAAAVPVPAPKVFTLTSTPQYPVYSQSVKLAVTITPKGGGAPKGGTVTFLLGDTPIGTAVATKRITTFTTDDLPPGIHNLRATYSGDAVVAPSSTSLPDNYRVDPAPTAISVATTIGTVTEGERAEIKATVRPTAPAARNVRPGGTMQFVTFGCGDIRTSKVKVNSNGVATWRPLLCVGTHDVEVSYDGTELHAPTGVTTTTVTVEEEPTGPTSVVDQENTAEHSDIAQVVDDGEYVSDVAQVFTAGITGDLDAVDLKTMWYDEDGVGADLVVSIESVGKSGLPTGEVLGWGTLQDTGELPPDLELVEQRVVLTQTAPVVAGTRYAIVLRGETSSGFPMWFLSTTAENPPHVGSLSRCCDAQDAWTGGQGPIWFRTYVAVDPT